MVLLRSIGFIAASYTSWIEYKRYESRRKHREININDLGQIEQILYNDMNTGDLVLFSRRWYHYHIPMAAAVLLYQWYYETEYDHAGVILIDPMDGVPYLLEANPCSKPSVRQFYNRVDRSKAESILLVKLNRKIQTKEKPAEICHGLSSGHGMEALSIPTTIIISTFKKLWNFKESSLSYCPSSLFLRDFYAQRGFQMRLSDHMHSDEIGSQTISCKNIVDREVALCSSSSEKKSILLSRKDIYLKAR
jgi:hypothetical protein